MQQLLRSLILTICLTWPALLWGQTATVKIGDVFSPKDSIFCLPIIVDFSQTPDGVNGLDFNIFFNPDAIVFLGHSNVHPEVEELLYSVIKPGYTDIVLVGWYDLDNSIFFEDTLLCLEFLFIGDGCTHLDYLYGVGNTEVVGADGHPIFDAVFEPGSVCESLPRELILEVVPDSITDLANPQGAGTYYRDDVIDISVEEVEGFEFIGWEAANPDYQQYIAEPDSLSTTFTMPPEQDTDDIILTAVYEAILYSISILIDPDPIIGDPNPQGAGDEFVFKQAVCIAVGEVEGYVFVGWEAEDPADLALLPDPDAFENCFLMPSRDLEFTAVYDPIPYTLTLLVDPEEITDQADPRADPENPHGYPDPMTYHIGDEITLTTQDVEGYDFTGWVTDDPDHQDLIGDADALETSFIMPPDNVTITATYELTKYTITLMVDPSIITDDAAPAILFDNPHGDPPDDIHYRMGDEIGISVQEVPGYAFVGWFPDNPDDLILTDDSESLTNGFTMPPQDVVLTARYELIDYTLSLNVDPETLTEQAGLRAQNMPYNPADDNFFNLGDEVRVSTSDIPGYYFTGWTSATGHDDLIENSMSWSFTFEMPAEDVSFTANYTLGTYQVYLITDPSDIAPLADLQGNGFHPYDSEVHIAASEVPGYRFSHWEDTYGMGNIGYLDDTLSLTNSFRMPAAFLNYTAVYVSLNELQVVIEGEGSASINGTPYTEPLLFDPDEIVDAEAMAADGWEFTGWANTNQDDSLATTVTMDTSKTITATFALKQYTLTIDIAGSGTVTVNDVPYSEPLVFNHGEVAVIHATPGNGWLFDGWGIDITGTLNPYSLLMEDNNHVEARFIRKAYNLVVHTEGNGHVNVDGIPYTDPLTFLHGDNPSLRAWPDQGYRFDGWSGDLSGPGNPKNLRMEGNRTVTATFSEIPPGESVLTIIVEGEGQVSVDGIAYTGAITATEGTSFDLAAVANEGWHFVGWSGDLESTDAEETIELDDNKTITAIFEINTYTLTVETIGNGSVLINDTPFTDVLTFNHGETPAVEAIAAEGWQFDDWSGSVSAVNSQDNPLTLVMDANKTITATFTEIPPEIYTLSIVIAGSGQVLVDGSPYVVPVTAEENTLLQLQAIATEGWQFDGWSGDVSGNNSQNNPLALLMNGNKTITAIFTEIPPVLYTLNILIDGSGQVLVDGNPYIVPVTAEENTLLQLQAIVAEGWQFDGWSGAVSAGNSQDNPLALLMDGNKTITATFTEIPPEIYTLSIVIAGSGQALADGNPYIVPVTAEENTLLQLQAIAAEGWQFDGWSGDVSGNNSQDNPLALLMDGNKTITATFTEIPPEIYTLSIVISGSGQALVDGNPYIVPVTAEENTLLQLQAIAAEGWQFDGWSGDVTGNTSQANPLALLMDGNKTITATFTEIPPTLYTLTVEIIGGGSVRANGILYSGPMDFEEGQTAQLEALADQGWTFEAWSLDHTGQELVADLLMDGNKTVRATFQELPPPNYTLTANSIGQGEIRVDGMPYDEPQSHVVNTNLLIAAIPSPGWYFAGWEGALQGPSSPQLLIMNEDKAITARFEPYEYTLTITIAEGSGSVNVDGEPYTGVLVFRYDDAPLVEAVPASGWQFDGWTGDLVSTELTANILIDGNKQLTASFSEIPPTIYTLTVNVAGSGEALVDGLAYTLPIEAVEGTTLNLQAIASEGWQFDNWSGDASGDLEEISLVMDADKTLTAHFSLKEYVLTIETTGGGHVVVDGNPYNEPLTFDHGETALAEALADEGWQFAGWSGDMGGGNSTINPIALFMDNDKTLVATFILKQYTLTIDTAGQGHVRIDDSLYTGTETFDHGSSPVIEAIPDAGWQFDGWSGDLSGTESIQTLLMDGNKQATASFSEIPPPVFTITFVVQTSTGIAVSDAVIQFNGSSYAQGVYVFSDLLAGNYSYQVSRNGFQSVSGTASLVDTNLTIQIILVVDPVRINFIIVYPNPTNSLLTIESNAEFDGIEVFNMLGQVMMTSSFGYTLKHTIDVGTFASGVYMIRAHTARDTRNAKFEVVK